MSESIRDVVRPPRFKLKEIMTPWQSVQTKTLLTVSQGRPPSIGVFEYVPIMQGRIINGILDVRSNKIVPVTGMFVSASAHLLEALGIAKNYSENRPSALLVGTVQKPAGIVTHSDLNKRTFGVMLYLLFFTLEARLSALISQAGADNWWEGLLRPRLRRQIDDRYATERKLRVDLDKLSCCHFSEKVRILQKTPTLASRFGQDASRSLGGLVKWRNRLVHPTNPPRLILNRSELPSLWRSMIATEEILTRISRAD